MYKASTNSRSLYKTVECLQLLIYLNEERSLSSSAKGTLKGFSASYISNGGLKRA